MMEDARTIYRATRIQSIAKYLERIGDHATNLAEQVVFMVERQDIRHQGKLDEPGAAGQPRAVLFLCVANSARSQLAEGLARTLFPRGVRVMSAGSEPAAAVHPEALAVLREDGIDVSEQRPKHVSAVLTGEVDLIVSLCAEEVCPAVASHVRREAWPLPDPAVVAGDAATVRAAFRATRDELRRRLTALVAGWR
jgi:arsenate reductase